MKDWKAECEILKGRMIELEKRMEYYRRIVESARDRDSQLRDKFKDLLVEVLGR